jgi:hypothetical protein
VPSGGYFDICFIDGSHEYIPLKRDYINFEEFCNIIAFHDIVDPKCPEVKKFWNNLKNELLSSPGKN